MLTRTTNNEQRFISHNSDEGEGKKVAVNSQDELCDAELTYRTPESSMLNSMTRGSSGLLLSEQPVDKRRQLAGKQTVTVLIGVQQIRHHRFGQITLPIQKYTVEVVKKHLLTIG